MRCKDHSVRQILIGLHRVGIVGLADAIKGAEASDLRDRESIVELILAMLRPDNYIPEQQLGDYRRALWREFLRHSGEDLSDFYTEIPVIIRGDPGEDRDRFLELTRAAMARFELQPVVELAPPGDEGPNPQLVIGGEVVARGPQTPRALENAVRRSLSDW